MILDEKPVKNNSDWWADRVKRLLEDQKTEWRFLKDNYEGQSSVKIRSFEFDGHTVKLQFNPARMKSSSADVSTAAINSRDCFLCLDNIPSEQNGLRYEKKFVILSNPYPIFQEHFTIVNKKHTEQTLIGHFDDFLNLCRDLGKHFSLLYNGPRCGASAPDHMHFQAYTKNATPLDIEFDSLKTDKRINILKTTKIEIRFFEHFLRYFFSIESESKGEILFAFKTFIKAFKKISIPKEEPMMNLTVSFDKGLWRVIVFPRSKHRPSQFYNSDVKKLVVSPAAVDLSGLIIVPREKDFENINGDDIVDIYKQVSLTKEYFEYLKKKLGEVFE